MKYSSMFWGFCAFAGFAVLNLSVYFSFGTGVEFWISLLAIATALMLLTQPPEPVRAFWRRLAARTSDPGKCIT